MFNLLDGLAHCPIVGTCDYALEISMNYQTYLEISNEFCAFLFSEDPIAWIMDVL